MTANRRPSTPIAALLGALLLATWGSPALAQSISQPQKATVAKTKKAATATKPASANGDSGDYWSANTDLGKYSGGDPTIDRRPAQRDIGRVPLQNSAGSVGFDSKPANIGKFGDGRSVPGHDAYTQQSSSYVGLSLSVPSDTKGFPIVSPSSVFPGAAGGNNGW
jgi:hypothetical protein